MTDDPAFLRAIDAAPDDDTVRLVYADWLDERGDPRGEYLRTEVERHRLGPRKKAWADLSKRLAELRPPGAGDWLSRVDRDATRYSFFWPRDYCHSLRSRGVKNTPLTRVNYRGNARSLLPKGAGPGDYVYVLSFDSGAVLLIARMVIAKIEINYRVFSAASGSEGTPICLTRTIPTPVLACMSWYSGKEIRRARLTDDGRLASFESVGRSLRLLPQTAADFDSLLRGEQR